MKLPSTTLAEYSRTADMDNKDFIYVISCGLRFAEYLVLGFIVYEVLSTITKIVQCVNAPFC